MKRFVVAAAVAVALLASMAPGCTTGTGTGGISVSGGSSGGGAAVLVVHPWVRKNGVWIRSGHGWGWITAGAAAGTLGALIEGTIGPATETGHGSVGYVPYARTLRCRNSKYPDIVSERWVSFRSANKLFLKCSQVRNIWKKYRGTRGKDILGCITWILARGGTMTASGGTWWSWGGGSVFASSDGEIITATPAKGDWAKCARG